MKQTKTAAGTVLFLAVLLSIGCSSDDAGVMTLKNPDSISVTTLTEIHGRRGHQGSIHIGPNNQHPEDAGMAKQVVLEIHDSAMSPYPLYLTVSTTSIGLGRMVDHLREAIDITIIPDLPEDAEPWTRMVWTFGGAGGDRFVGCLRVVTAMETVYLPLRGTTTEAWRARILQELSKPPKVLDTQPAQVVSIDYYLDERFTEPLADTVYVGDTVYTKVVFSKGVPVVFADDGIARPHISSTVEQRGPSVEPRKEFQYRIVPSDAPLERGTAQPYQGTDHVFICVYVVQGKDFAGTFRSHANYGATSGSALQIRFFQYTGELPAEIGETITTWSPTDFTGQVYTQRDSDIWFEMVDGVYVVKGGVGVRDRSELIAGVTITIVTGPRQGEQSLTDRNGRYLFPNVSEESLHLRAERRHFEPKEVLVHRSAPTALANGDVPNFSGDPQRTPGNILIGQVWPDEVRPILAETLVVYDLLYFELLKLETRNEVEVAGSYSRDGIISVFSTRGVDFKNPSAVLNTLAHEIAHAHQHAVVSVDGNDEVVRWGGSWRNSPEGQAFAVAWERDLEEVGVTYYDIDPYYRDNIFENAAETCAFYWEEWLGLPPILRLPGRAGKTMKDIAPHRYRWAEEWVIQK